MTKKRTAGEATANDPASRRPAQSESPADPKPASGLTRASQRPITLAEIALRPTSRPVRERGAILDRIACLEITPGDGEAEAARRGLPPLNPKPDPAEFDLMREPDWTLAMAAAWIAWRAPESVRHFWDAWRDKVFCWRMVTLPNPGGGEPRREIHLLPSYRLHARCAELSIVALLSAGSEFAPRMSGEQAMAELWTALRAGRPALTAIDAQGRRIIDPSLELQDLEIGVLEGADLLWGKRLRHSAVYRYPTLARSEVMKIWKPDRRAVSAKAITDCKKWLIAEMKKSLHIPPAIHRDLQKHAQEQFPALTGRGFKDALRQAVNATRATAWIAPGRPKKSPQ